MGLYLAKNMNLFLCHLNLPDMENEKQYKIIIDLFLLVNMKLLLFVQNFVFFIITIINKMHKF